MEIGQVMIATSLAAALALLAPAPETLLPQEVPYSAVASGPVSNQPRLLNDQDTALFRQGLAAARDFLQEPAAISRCSSAKGTGRDSLIQIHMPTLSAQRSKELLDGVRASLADVRDSVGDFQTMRKSSYFIGVPSAFLIEPPSIVNPPSASFSFTSRRIVSPG